MSVQLRRNAEIPPFRLETSAGTVEVHVRGALLQAPGVQFGRLRPVEVVVTRTDGRVDRADVPDGGGGAVRQMLAIGTGIAALAILAERILKR